MHPHFVCTLVLKRRSDEYVMDDATIEKTHSFKTNKNEKKEKIT